MCSSRVVGVQVFVAERKLHQCNPIVLVAQDDLTINPPQSNMQASVQSMNCDRSSVKNSWAQAMSVQPLKRSPTRPLKFLPPSSAFPQRQQIFGSDIVYSKLKVSILLFEVNADSSLLLLLQLLCNRVKNEELYATISEFTTFNIYGHGRARRIVERCSL